MAVRNGSWDIISWCRGPTGAPGGHLAESGHDLHGVHRDWIRRKKRINVW